jgi:hypothetical protein
MIVIVAPENAPWLKPLTESLSGEVRLIAPWKSPLWLLVLAARRLVARGRTDRTMRATFLLRLLVGAFASYRLPKETRTVIAPALGAERLFAHAHARGFETVLVEDLPDLAMLHADLDEAVVHHPHTPWLKRFRASPFWVQRQRRERDLSDRLLVRSAFAKRQLIAAGRAAETIAPLPTPPLRLAPNRKGRLVLFAGLAAARNGIFEAIEATRRAGLTLLVRTGEGSERVFLQGHPHVREATTVEREQLAGVGVVLAPAWCESHSREVEVAARLGVPVVATDRATGFVEAFDPVERGNIWATVAALGRALEGKRAA